jgi:hypothetical protein
MENGLNTYVRFEPTYFLMKYHTSHDIVAVSAVQISVLT